MRKDVFPLAFGFTAAAILFVVSGSIGYTFSRRVGQYWGHWTGAPVAWEIGFGVICAVAAVLFWREALSSLVPRD
jgi:hypothetical protein